jgi:hypothetical protein
VDEGIEDESYLVSGGIGGGHLGCPWIYRGSPGVSMDIQWCHWAWAKGHTHGLKGPLLPTGPRSWCAKCAIISSN